VWCQLPLHHQVQFQIAEGEIAMENLNTFYPFKDGEYLQGIIAISY
jgi:hypothetical protein